RDTSIRVAAGEVREAVSEVGEDRDFGISGGAPVRSDEALGHRQRAVLVKLRMRDPDGWDPLRLARFDDAASAGAVHRRLVAEERLVALDQPLELEERVAGGPRVRPAVEEIAIAG